MDRASRRPPRGVPNDESRRPQWYKSYDEDLTRTLLPADLPVSEAPALAVLAGTARVPKGRLDLAALARLLHLSAGVTRTTVNREGVRLLFRAAGSAGARFPLELYVTVPTGLETDVPPGVHWYDPEVHALVTVGPPPTGTAPAFVVTGVPWRTRWRYAERGFRHIYWDAGTMLAHLLALADSAGLPARPHTTFPDVEVAALVGADSVTEFPVAVVALGPGDPALHPTGEAMPGRHDQDGTVFPLVTEAQRAGVSDRLGPELERGRPTPTETPPEPALTIDEVVRGKGSIRRLRADHSVDATGYEPRCSSPGSTTGTSRPRSPTCKGALMTGSAAHRTPTSTPSTDSPAKPASRPEPDSQRQNPTQNSGFAGPSPPSPLVAHDALVPRGGATPSGC